MKKITGIHPYEGYELVSSRPDGTQVFGKFLSRKEKELFDTCKDQHFILLSGGFEVLESWFSN